MFSIIIIYAVICTLCVCIECVRNKILVSFVHTIFVLFFLVSFVLLIFMCEYWFFLVCVYIFYIFSLKSHILAVILFGFGYYRSCRWCLLSAKHYGGRSVQCCNQNNGNKCCFAYGYGKCVIAGIRCAAIGPCIPHFCQTKNEKLK